MRILVKIINENTRIDKMRKHSGGKFMSRREIREHLFRMLFRKEFHEPCELNEQNQLYFENLEECPSSEQMDYLMEKYNAILVKVPEIDEMLESASEGWRLNRMGKAELTILRLAVYEMIFDEDIPVGVAINEAVELAKKYGGDHSKSFVNGILAKIVDKKPMDSVEENSDSE